MSSLYSLSKVPPVTRMRIGSIVARVFCQHSALYWSHPHARHALAPAGGNCRDPRRRWLPVPGTKKTPGSAISRRSRAASRRTSTPIASTGNSRQRPRQPAASSTDIDAESMQQVKDASRVDLKNVTLKLYNKNGKTYDLVKSAAATLQYRRAPPVFRRRRRDHPQPAGRRSTGQTADRHQDLRRHLRQQHRPRDTDMPSSFVFENGDGKATGAFYDPASHEC